MAMQDLFLQKVKETGSVLDLLLWNRRKALLFMTGKLGGSPLNGNDFRDFNSFDVELSFF